MSTRVAVLASGSGSNLQALLERFPHRGGPAGIAVSLVVSDREGSGALDRAAAAGVAGRVVPIAGRPEAEAAAALLGLLAENDIGVVALAGFLRRVPGEVVGRYRRRMLNIHPALLPAFGGKGMYGLNVHRAVLAAGCRVSGPSIHFVDEEYDAGPILVQWPVPVLSDDTPERLAARVLRAEHVLYPAALEAVGRALAAGGERAVEQLLLSGATGTREGPDPPGAPQADAQAGGHEGRGLSARPGAAGDEGSGPSPRLGGAGLPDRAGFRLEDAAEAPEPIEVRRLLGLE